MKGRLHYLDMLKGIAIFMVVMGHVIAFGVRQIDHTLIFKVIGYMHMPLFFFISGWLTCKTDANRRLLAPNMVKRACQLLVPLLVVPQLWLWYFPHSGIETPFLGTFKGLWESMMKYGYWFTLVLFIIFAVYAAVRPLINRCRSLALQCLLVACVWGAMYGLFRLMPPVLADTLSWYPAILYWPVFMCGLLTARHREAFYRVALSPTGVTVAILLAIPSLYYLCFYWEFESLLNAMPHFSLLAGAVFHISIAVIAIAVVKPWSERAFAPDATLLSRRTASVWTFLGQKSLSIYLIHYFLLFPLGCCREALVAVNLGVVPIIVFSAFWAAAIIGVVLIIDAIISRAPLIAWILTGTVPSFVGNAEKKRGA